MIVAGYIKIRLLYILKNPPAHTGVSLEYIKDAAQFANQLFKDSVQITPFHALVLERAYLEIGHFDDWIHLRSHIGRQEDKNDLYKLDGNSLFTAFGHLCLYPWLAAELNARLGTSYRFYVDPKNVSNKLLLKRLVKAGYPIVPTKSFPPSLYRSWKVGIALHDHQIAQESKAIGITGFDYLQSFLHTSPIESPKIDVNIRTKGAICTYEFNSTIGV